MITVRKATPDDAEDFAKLVLISAPYFPILFVDKIKMALCDLFQHKSNLFSFEHVYFAEIDGERAGMILGYDYQSKKLENLRTGFLLFKKIGASFLCRFLTLMKFNTIVGVVSKGEYYISNIAVYLQYRGRGVGKRLILEAEQEAKMVDAERMVLDVEKDNISAISLYKKLSYKITKKFSIPLQKDKILHFCRMTKEVK